jgi:hypothetical protein
MASQRQIEANRRNAQRSTGPKTRRGKQRSSRNAVKHGLNISIVRDPGATAEIERLAARICPSGGEDDSFHRAHKIAEKQAELRRVRRIRGELIEKLVVDLLNPQLGVPQQQANALEDVAVMLAKLSCLDRYQRRALSSQASAIRDYQAGAGRSEMVTDRNPRQQLERVVRPIRACLRLRRMTPIVLRREFIPNLKPWTTSISLRLPRLRISRLPRLRSLNASRSPLTSVTSLNP